MGTQFLIRVFGSPEAALPPHSSSFPSRGFAMLALLAVAPGRILSKAAVAEKIWCSDTSSASLSNLRQLLRRMTMAVPDLKGVLKYDLRSIWLTEECRTIDICCLLDIKECKDEETYRVVADVYRGYLLEPLDFPRTQLDELVLVWRAQLEAHFFGLVEDALASLTHYGSTKPKLLRDIENHSLMIDPDREDTYRALINAYGAVGHDKDARRVLDRLGSLSEIEASGSAPRNVPNARPRFVKRNSIEIARNDRTSLNAPRVALLAPSHLLGATLAEPLARAFIEDLANEMSKDNRFTTLAAHSTFQTTHDGGILSENFSLRADYTVVSTLHSGADLGEISLRLVDTKSGAIVWADRYDLAPASLFSTGRRIVARVSIDISSAIDQSLFEQIGNVKENTTYLDFLSGQRALKSCDLKSVRRARRHFLSSIRRNEWHSDSYAGVSFSLYLEWLLMGGTDPRLLAEARDLADSAIRGGPENPSGYWRKAMVALYQHDFETSEECFERAHALSPNSADITLDHGDALGFVGDPNLAWSMFEKAIDLNPTPPEHYWWAGASIAFSKANYEHAIELCDKVENEESVLRVLASCHGLLGNISEAREYGRRLSETYPGQTAEEMMRLQPHRKAKDLEPFIEGLKRAGVK